MPEPEINISEVHSRFPEKREYFVSAEEVLTIMQRTLAQVKDFRQKDLHVLRDVLWPLLPPRARRFFRCVKPDQISIAYADLVNRLGRAAALLTLWNMPAAMETVQQYYRFAVLPFVELMLREKYRELENARSLKQRLWRSIYGRILEGLTGTVDNLVHLIVLAWTFSPGIGEPDEHTGFYNRYVLGRYCGILDLGHFFNCAAVAYLYGEEEGRKRGEQIERRQRWLRKQKWLVDWRKQKESRMGRWFADFLWGFAASADTIEDRSSDWFGIQLGQRMRAFRKNERIIEYFMRAWPHMVKSKIPGEKKESRLRAAWSDIMMIFAVWRQVWSNGGVFDIAGDLQQFFQKQDALVPQEVEKLAPGLLAEIIEAYREHYDSEAWANFTAQKWEIVFPQELWEKVVRPGWNGKGTDLPVKIQLKHNGEKVEPYFREETD
jgi:hypothetical protein